MYSTLLIGLGNIGLKYDLNIDGIQTHSKALSQSPFFHIDTVVDPDPLSLSLFSQYYSCKRSYHSINSIPKSLTFDLCVLAVPSSIHLSVITELFDHFVDPPSLFLLEKPVGISSSECIEIFSLLNQHRSSAFVNYVRSYYPSWQNFISNSGQISNISFFLPPTLLNNGSHFLYLLDELKDLSTFAISCNNIHKSLDHCFSLESNDFHASFFIKEGSHFHTFINASYSSYFWLDNWSTYIIDNYSSSSPSYEFDVSLNYQSHIYQCIYNVISNPTHSIHDPIYKTIENRCLRVHNTISQLNSLISK